MNDHISLEFCQAALAAAFGKGPFDAAQTLIRGGRGLSPRQRLEIYRNGIRETQGEALSDIYPAVARLLGSEFFAHMAILYADLHPSAHGDLRLFGSALPTFLECFEPVSHLNYLGDVARLEWAGHDSFHAAAIETSPLASTQPHHRLRLAPHVRFVRSDFPIAEIWEFALSEHRQDQPQLDVDRETPSHVLVSRPALEVQVMTLPPEDWMWLRSLEDRAKAPEEIDVSLPSAQTLDVYRQLGILC